MGQQSQRVSAKREHLAWKRVGEGRGILLDLRSGRYYSLNETAARVWEMFETGPTIGDVVARVQGDFGGVPPTVQGDIEELVSFLAEKDMISLGAAPSPEGSTPQSGEREDVCSDVKPYEKPLVREHEPLQQLTAASGGGGGGGGGGTYYYTTTCYYPN